MPDIRVWKKVSLEVGRTSDGEASSDDDLNQPKEQSDEEIVIELESESAKAKVNTNK